MAGLTVVTFWWGGAYGKEYPTRLAAAVKRNLKQPHQFLIVTDRVSLPRAVDGAWLVPLPNPELTKVKGCFVRLCLFDLMLQNAWDMDDRIACLDLDLVVTGGLDELLDRPDSFTILQGINSTNPCPYNGSVWMLRAGHCPEVWTDFSIAAAAGVPFHEFPDDQGWFHYKMPGAGSFGPETGVYGFKKKGWPSGDDLPPNARIVAFPGWRDPAKFIDLPWIRYHWVVE